jgi:hypothetical protein
MITKKTPYKGNRVFRQDQHLIYYSHYQDLLHEFAHWIVSHQPEHPNLGFEDHFNYNSGEYPVELLIDELKARYLTYLFYQEVMPVDDTAGHLYANYMLENATDCDYPLTMLHVQIQTDICNRNLKSIFSTLRSIRDEVSRTDTV